MLKLAIALATSVGFVPPSEVPPGQSTVGSKIVVQGYECTVMSLSSIQCQATGPVCVANRARAEAISKHYLGCGLDEWKTSHPGESCDDRLAKSLLPSTDCMATYFGGF